MKAFLGNYVVTEKHNHYGRVYAKHHNFDGTRENEDWFRINHIAESDRNKNWYSILVHQGGSVLVPESDIKTVSSIPLEEGFENIWESHYFEIIRPIKNATLAESFDTFYGQAESINEVLRRISMQDDIEDDGLTEEETEEVDQYVETMVDEFEGHVAEGSWLFLPNERVVIRYVLGDTGFVWDEDDLEDIM